MVFEAHGFSPRLRSVELITDYMGCPDISGNELMDRFIEHASQAQQRHELGLDVEGIYRAVEELAGGTETA